MIQIHISDTLAALVPEVHRKVDPDTPLYSIPTDVVKRTLKLVLLRALRDILMADEDIELVWVLVIGKDPILNHLRTLKWDDIEVLDSMGTFIINGDIDDN